MSASNTNLAPNDLDSYWMPFTANRAFKKKPRIVHGAKDMHYLRADGSKVLDATAGLWCVNAGHAPPFQFAHPKVFALAARIAAMAPGDLDHVFFCSSGSEAVDSALKIALAYFNVCGKGQKTRLIGRERGYHGVGFGGISVGGMVNNRKFFGGLLAGVDHMPHTYNRAEQAYTKGEPGWGAHLADDLEKIVTLHDASTIAAVIVEPMAGSTGVLPPPLGYLKRLREICDKHGILLIFDEVISGFGRMGFNFAAERYGVIPDMITFAKGITSGTVPMGGVVVRKHIFDAFMKGDEHVIELFHGYTYSGHPLAAAAGLATLELYKEEGLFERAKAMEPIWADAIFAACKGLPHVEDIRTIGLVAAVDLKPIDGKPSLRGYNAMEHAFHVEDMMMRYTGDTLVVTPPLIISESQVGELAEKMARTIHAVA
jgi:beta-alanine--pyruvate transaminase